MKVHNVILPYGERTATMAPSQEESKESSAAGSNITPGKEEIHENYSQVSENMDSIYYNALDQIADGDNAGGVNIGEVTYGAVYKSYNVIAKSAPYIFAFSVLLCIFICAVSRKNKRIRRWAIIWLGLGVPVALIVFVFGLGASPLFAA